MKRLGSYRRRAAPASRSNLGTFLEKQYGCGKASSYDVARAAASSSKDDPCNGLKRLEGCRPFKCKRVRKQGKLKPDTRNSARDLGRILSPRSVLYPALRHPVPVWDPHTKRRVMKHIKILPIHESLDALVGTVANWNGVLVMKVSKALQLICETGQLAYRFHFSTLFGS